MTTTTPVATIDMLPHYPQAVCTPRSVHRSDHKRCCCPSCRRCPPMVTRRMHRPTNLRRIAIEIVDDLGAALKQFGVIAGDLSEAQLRPTHEPWSFSVRAVYGCRADAHMRETPRVRNEIRGSSPKRTWAGNARGECSRHRPTTPPLLRPRSARSGLWRETSATTRDAKQGRAANLCPGQDKRVEFSGWHRWLKIGESGSRARGCTWKSYHDAPRR